MDKACRTCGQVKPPTEFHVRRSTRTRNGERYTYEHVSATCKDCEHAAKSAWRATPGGKASERLFRQTNEKHRNYRQTDAGRAATERYRMTIDNLLRQSRADYKARGGMGSVTLTVDELAALLERYQMTCAYCRREVLVLAEVGDERKLTLDHVRPILQGGGHTADNVVPACWRCNERKGTHPLQPLPPPAARSAGV